MFCNTLSIAEFLYKAAYYSDILYRVSKMFINNYWLLYFTHRFTEPSSIPRLSGFRTKYNENPRPEGKDKFFFAKRNDALRRVGREFGFFLTDAEGSNGIFDDAKTMKIAS